MPITTERGKLAFEKAERDLLRLRSGQPPEIVHSFRTTTRRLQTLLEQLIAQRDRNEKKLLKTLDRIRKRAGKVRDLDVQLAALRSLKTPQEPRRKTQLTQGLIGLRAQHEKKLRKLLTKDTVRGLRKRLKRASREVNFETCRDPLAVAHELVAQISLPAGTLPEDVLHRYRLLVKRARYAAEFAPQSDGARRFIAELKRLQDALGNWHDWMALTQTAAKRLGEISESPLVAALHNVSGGKFRHAIAALSASPTLRTAPKPISSASGPPPSEPPRKPRTKSAGRLERADSAA